MYIPRVVPGSDAHYKLCSGHHYVQIMSIVPKSAPLYVMHAQLMFPYRYVLRVEAMKVFLEFSDKKAELQPALHVLCTAVNGKL